MVLAVAGLFIMLRRQAGDGYSLTFWLGLIALAAGGLVSSGREIFALAATLAGLATTVYLRTAEGVAVSAGGAGGAMRIDLALGAYVIFAIVLAVIWAARRRSAQR